MEAERRERTGAFDFVGQRGQSTTTVDIELRGFGSFSVREYKSYNGRNPKTGEPVHVASKRLPFFKVGKELKEMIQQAPFGS